ncbi:hypothetical protein BHE74_00053434 [Ensete ventricosum]|nr:hypothetical protein BHE74_00053434 [Ensete ventricosum]
MSKEREDCESADWSSLEPGILELIAEQLVADTANHVRFGAVCKAWYVAAGANQRRRSHPRVGSLSSLSARGRARSRFQRLMDTAAVEQLPDKKENSFAPREVCRWKWKLIDLTSSRCLCWRRVQLNRVRVGRERLFRIAAAAAAAAESQP